MLRAFFSAAPRELYVYATTRQIADGSCATAGAGASTRGGGATTRSADCAGRALSTTGAGASCAGFRKITTLTANAATRPATGTHFIGKPRSAAGRRREVLP